MKAQLSLFQPAPEPPQITRAEAPAPYSRRRERAEAYAAWVADGRPWPPPAGMLSAIMQPFMPRRR